MICSLLGMRGIVRMLRRVWELCHEHIVVCLEEGGKDGRGEYERNKIIASTHQAIDQVRNCIYMYMIM